MKTNLCILAALAALAVPLGTVASPVHVAGEVFIVIAGGDNKLLGRVEVAAYKPD